MNHSLISNAVQNWVWDVVIGLNLCPFAKREWVKNRVRFQVSQAADEDQLLEDLAAELALIQQTPAIETTLLICPDVLQDFFDFNQFLARAESRLAQLKLKGIFQVASFHPEYQFAGTELDDAENYTNKSPYPVLHLLREASLDRAVAHYPDVDLIPERNIARLEQLGANTLAEMLQHCAAQDRLQASAERIASKDCDGLAD